jgi:hypothetical protein
MARRGWWAAAAVVVAAALPAAAHQGDPNVFTRIDAVTPELPGVTVEVRSGVADQLLVVNTTPTPVEVLDASGRTFLRIGPDDVEADYAEPDWYTSNSPLGAARTPAPGGKPDWRVVARGNAWGWFDHRLHERPFTAPPAARTVTRLAEWSVPLRHNGSRVTVRGHVEYRPVVGSFRTAVAKVPDGVTLDALDGRVPGLFLQWRGPGTLTVRGIEGEPFARFTSNGVEVNDASATWQDDQRLRGTAPAVPADPVTPRWRKAQAAPSLTWLDRRLSYAPGVPPADALRSVRPTTLVEWDLPADVDGVPARLQGTTSWIPNATGARDDGGTPWLPVVLVAFVVVVAAAVLRRRAER